MYYVIEKKIFIQVKSIKLFTKVTSFEVKEKGNENDVSGTSTNPNTAKEDHI